MDCDTIKIYALMDLSKVLMACIEFGVYGNGDLRQFNFVSKRLDHSTIGLVKHVLDGKWGNDYKKQHL